MEGLPYDFGIEDDPDDDGVEKKDKKPQTSILESLKNKTEKEKPKGEGETPSKEALLESREDEPIDNAPELDAQAPLEHMSEEEARAVAQTMATERLNEISVAETPKDDEVTSENLAAESFLENVEATGDIDQAYHETLIELGEMPARPRPVEDQYQVRSETAMPVDPESLLQDAKNELTAGVSYHIDRDNAQDGSTKTPGSADKPRAGSKSSQPERGRTVNRSHKLHEGIVDYLVGRRFARIAAETKQDRVENRLSNEVSQLHLELASRETHVRQVAQNKLVEKKNKPTIKTKETEAIGRVLVDSELPERPVGHRNETAGISAHTMKRGELLKIASAIKVEGSSLKQIYETHLVGEKGLRRVVAEYLRGGNYVKSLKRELIEREKDFERDPKLRDQGSLQSMPTDSSGLDNLLQKSGIEWNEPQPIFKQAEPKANTLAELASQGKSPFKSFRRIIDVVMIGVIVIMAAVITILILTK